MIRRSLAIATTNAGKITELARLLDGLPYEAVALSALFPSGKIPVIAETGTTFRDNALLKARTLVDLTGIAALADDSGLEVDALGGAPGVLSARFAGPEHDSAANLALLLERLRAVTEPSDRTARFRCAIALVDPWRTPREEVWEGACEGAITASPRGSGGFGYDPVFLPERESRTMAELSGHEKDAISHRGRALLALRTALRNKAS